MLMQLVIARKKQGVMEMKEVSRGVRRIKQKCGEIEDDDVVYLYACPECGFVDDEPFDICPVCNEELKWGSLRSR